MNSTERREKLKKALANKSKAQKTILAKVIEISEKFEVTDYKQDKKYDLLTLSNIVHKIITDPKIKPRTIQDLEKFLGIDLVYFQDLRLAVGWNSFTSKNTGLVIPKREGNAELAVDLMLIIEEELGFEPDVNKYSEFTQEYLDKQNNRNSTLQADIIAEDTAYKSLLNKLQEKVELGELHVK